jgi:hypothetical protein
MGAGILPAAIYNNKLYFLFGKENKYADTPGWSDFGGGKENNETFIETAVREGVEELTGFLGTEKDVRRLLKKKGTYNIDLISSGHLQYRLHIFPIEYDEKLPFYYNNNQRFLQSKLDPTIIRESKIFEKSEIKWIGLDQLSKMKSQFRSYFQNMVNKISDEKSEIDVFIRKSLKTLKTRKNR